MPGWRSLLKPLNYSCRLKTPLQALVRPYLDSKFSLKKVQVLPKGVVYGSPRGCTFQKWMYTWPNQLTMFHASGARVCVRLQSLFPVQILQVACCFPSQASTM